MPRFKSVLVPEYAIPRFKSVPVPIRYNTYIYIIILVLLLLRWNERLAKKKEQLIYMENGTG
jgi:hypothetical protein